MFLQASGKNFHPILFYKQSSGPKVSFLSERFLSSLCSYDLPRGTVLSCIASKFET